MISWSSKKKPIVALSSTKTEYIAENSTSCQVVWLKRLLFDFGYTKNELISILCDNTSAISLSNNNVFHQKSKHIDSHFHFIRELVKNGDIVLKFCDSKEQLADIFTKPIGKFNFEFQCKKIGIKIV